MLPPNPLRVFLVASKTTFTSEKYCILNFSIGVAHVLTLIGAYEPPEE